MALELHVSGPGLEVTRRLEAGDPALILGRDSDCAICLPDPERNVSRRHLSVWNEGGQLHFHVLSVVNGVETEAGELPPGARGVLRAGDTLGLSAFRIRVLPPGVHVAPAVADPNADPWLEFQRQAAELAGDAGPETVPAPLEDDPFGDWGFQSTFGPGAPGGGLHADALLAAEDLQPFFNGLGLDRGAQGNYTQGELETMGRLTRIALQGLLQAYQDANDSRRQVRAEDRQLADGRELNPLRLDTPLEAKLYYLFGGQGAAHGYVPPDRAVAQVVTELTAHQQAMGETAREALEGVIADFDPEAIKKRLLGGGTRLFESARAWDAFVREYAERSGSRAEWVQQLLERHFARAYAKALMRAKRNTSGRPPS
ncbi:MAG TPA: type VI secretion system-associated FHA domain protein [Ramlibacter sp.]|nr:type VI secretion system-associated FHA domain protein [Ramlibacter sp.]